MVVYLVVPLVPSIPSSSHPLTVMALLVSSWPDVRKDLRIFENGVGFIRLPGCITPKKASLFCAIASPSSASCFNSEKLISEPDIIKFPMFNR